MQPREIPRAVDGDAGLDRSLVADPPESAEDIYVPAVGQIVSLRAGPGGHEPFVVVKRLRDRTFRVEPFNFPPAGKRWNMMGFEVNQLLAWGFCALRVRGRTRKALNLQPVGWFSPREEAEASSEATEATGGGSGDG